MDEEISNECLNQFIDGELDALEESRIHELIKLHPALRDRVEELRRIRSLFRLAFQDTADDSTANVRPEHVTSTRMKAAVVAAIMIAGGLLGWFSHARLVLSPGTVDVPHNVFAVQSTQEGTVGATKIVFHISHPGPKSINAALQEAEQLLILHKKNNKPLALEILVNASNLSLVRADSDLYKKRVRSLQSRYPNLKFLACSITVRKQGNPALLPGVIIVPSARGQIINRLKQGWGYIQA